MFSSVAATNAEKAAARPGDAIVATPDVVMDRAFTVAGAPEQVWPWLVQLGKQRAGWYLPRPVERFVPMRRRASRTVDARWLDLRVGDVIPDYGGRDATFEVAEIDRPRALVYRSQRGRSELTWSISLEPLEDQSGPPSTRVFLRLRIAPVKRRWLAHSAGELIDLLTVAGMAAGLRERLPTP